MIDQAYIELMHKEIDEVISPEEHEKLFHYLETVNEANNFYQDLVKTSNLLKEIPAVEPPKNLKTDILDSINWNRYKQRKKKFSLNLLFTDWMLRPQLKLAYAFAIGLIAGVIVYSLFITSVKMNNQVNTDDLYGTIGIKNPENLKELQKIPLDLDELQGDIYLRQFKNFIIFDINLHSKLASELFLGYESASYQFQGFHQASDNNIFLEEGKNFVKVSNLESANYQIFFNRDTQKPTPIDLKISISGQVRIHQSVYVNVY
jgi:hypothetical protein